MVEGTPSSKPEFPPLFPIGRHQISLANLKNKCADTFTLSITRSTIMTGLEKAIKKLQINGVQGEVWVDGSFVTEKINPEDVDIVLRMQAGFFENITVEQSEAINWIKSGYNNGHLCHGFYLIEWPEGHPKYWTGHYMYNYWMRQFGFSRGDEVKGIPVISL